MDYYSVAEIAERWGQTPRSIQQYCAQGRITGAVRFGRAWMIPADAQKPRKNQCARPDWSTTLLLDYTPILSGHADEIPAQWSEPEKQRQVQAELNCYRGNFSRKMLEDLPVTNPSGLVIRATVAISLGDYALFRQSYNQLKALEKSCRNPTETINVSVQQALLAISLGAPQLCPEWLRKGELSIVPVNLRTGAMYAYTKYLYCIKEYKKMLGVAETALLYIQSETYTIAEIYLRLMAMLACIALRELEQCDAHLKAALELAAPDGIIMPFAELFLGFTAQMKKELSLEQPELYRQIQQHWEVSWRNWIIIHNEYTKENITTLLTLKEYGVAQLLVRDFTYQEAADYLGISTGRVKNIVQTIYDKLMVRKKSELKELIP